MSFSLPVGIFSLICSSFLILLLHFLITKPWFYKYFRVDSIGVLVMLIAIRMFLPFDFDFTKTIHLPPTPPSVQPTIAAVNKALTSGFIPMFLLGGSLIALVYQIFHLIKIKRQLNQFLEKKVILTWDNGYEIAQIQGIDAPFILGKTIYIPEYLELSDEELKAVIDHEKAHHLYKHYVFKFVFNILKIIYWWWPFVYLLEKDALLYLELKADFEASKKQSEADYDRYAQIILDIQKKIRILKPTLNIGSSFMKYSSETATRIRFYIEGEDKPKTNRALMLFFFIILLIPSVVVVKPYILPYGYGTEVFFEEDIIPFMKDGKYYLQVGDDIVQAESEELIETFFSD